MSSIQTSGIPLKKKPSERLEKDTVQTILSKIKSDFQDVEFLTALSQKLNVNEGYLIIGFFGISFVFIILNLFSTFFVFLIAFTYPAYQSIILTTKTNVKDRDEYKQWVSYWGVLGFLELFDSLLMFIFEYFLPFYNPIKVLFLIWMFYPKSKGATILYEKGIKRLMIIINNKLAEISVDETPEMELSEVPKER